ncbi:MULTISPECIES: methionine ABC transporter ATP-binding protein [unclassified Microbacterium]|uniref:methionine ABC transporter ATP-binding protein n=1 Tax=unclassified Microbacterium TaxID=2609290 RepID=UPI000EA94908|nr:MULTISPECIES: methionine ABC transporter ATP-binding protein [unclassified Microbacterium]MBT2484604.1 methionine ABC transporter ATP-binding protein [Microbacterium sp. ISL-108]RKN67496.1 methionine ABC transporter ATP-binding protein [Microbacterium sp. CGR2]
MTERIQLTGVSKDYPAQGKGDPVRVLRDIDISVQAGEIYGLIGRSGAGKSTLLRMINGLEKPTEGQVLVDGVDVHALPPAELRALRHSIGMVFQQFNLWNSRTVFGNIATPLKLAGWKDADISRRVGELLDFVGLGGKAFARPRQLSGGQKQRVGIARAIAARPSVLLADEATSALDPQTTTEIVDLLRSVNEEFGITIVVVTHEMDVMSQLADRVSILSNGDVVESGDIHQILARPQHPITANLVGSYTRTMLSEKDRRALAAEFEGRLISVAMDGVIAEGPLLSSLARAHGVDFSIIQGGVARVKNLPYGQLSLALHGQDDDVERFLAELATRTEVTTW